MPKEDYIPVCEYDQKHKCDGTRWFECPQGGDSGFDGQRCVHVVYAPKEFLNRSPRSILFPSSKILSKKQKRSSVLR